MANIRTGTSRWPGLVVFGVKATTSTASTNPTNVDPGGPIWVEAGRALNTSTPRHAPATAIHATDDTGSAAPATAKRPAAVIAPTAATSPSAWSKRRNAFVTSAIQPIVNSTSSTPEPRTSARTPDATTAAAAAAYAPIRTTPGSARRSSATPSTVIAAAAAGVTPRARGYCGAASQPTRAAPATTTPPS